MAPSVTIPSGLKRVFLRQIAEGAKKSQSTLGEALLAFQSQVFTPTFKAGKVILATSGSGQSVSFSHPFGGFSPQSVAMMSEELISIHDQAIIAGASGEVAQIDALRAVLFDFIAEQSGQSTAGDFTLLRTGA